MELSDYFTVFYILSTRLQSAIEDPFLCSLFSISEHAGTNTPDGTSRCRQISNDGASNSMGYIPLKSSFRFFGNTSPMNTPVVAIARLFIRRDSVDAVQELTERVHTHHQEIHEWHRT